MHHRRDGSAADVTDPELKGTPMKPREAAMIPGLLAAFVQFLLPFFHSIPADVVGGVNAATAFLAGLVTAFLVSQEKGLALLVGSGNTLVQIALAFGVHLSDAQMSLIPTILTLVAAAFTRTQVSAPVAPAPVQAAPSIRNQAGGQV